MGDYARARNEAKWAFRQVVREMEAKFSKCAKLSNYQVELLKRGVLIRDGYPMLTRKSHAGPLPIRVSRVINLSFSWLSLTL